MGKHERITEAKLRRAIKAARDADPLSTIELAIGSMTIRTIPPGADLDGNTKADPKLGLPKQW